ncbi:UvrD-helicase domain-containing protein [Candidatus Profftia tarda]|uniref:UvrD-helicase domain-containing protein n=1 Tax=Candidatus Profftia tarda TaxID=1177216 RepID=UPI002A4E10B2|nr:UvrD-helicase domain-containing protein [Candidatus Profftia tarda]
MINNKTLDPFSCPLIGECLIESSAGTGKTFTIVILYLRLLLGLGGKDICRPSLSIKKILVVTFTESATEELRGRIRDNIHALRLACMRGRSNNPALSALLNLIHNKNNAINQLLRAERHMDHASIFTIHSFCQRILKSNALESGSLFKQILIENELPLLRQACSDFWRRYCYSLPLSIAKIINQEWSGPDQLLMDLEPYLYGELPELRQVISDDDTLLQRHEKNINRINRIKFHWLQLGGNIERLILDYDLDKRSYSSSLIPKWLRVIGDWVLTDTLNYQFPSELKRFGQNILLKKTKKKIHHIINYLVTLNN